MSQKDDLSDAFGRIVEAINLAASRRPNAFSVVSGVHIDAATGSPAAGTLALVDQRVVLNPFVPRDSFSIDRIGVSVTTAVASSVAKIAIYSSDVNGLPSVRLWVGDSDLNTAGTGFKFHDVSFAFGVGRQYWLAIHASGGPTIRSIPLTGAVNLGVNGPTTNTYRTVIQRDGVSYAAGMPESWSFSEPEMQANVTPPSIRMRIL